MSLLETRALTASYGQFRALFGVDFRVEPGEVVAIIGANGAGKTTLLRSITGILRQAPEMVQHRGDAIGALPPDRIMQRGISMVPEGRKLFPSLSVEENLRIGAQVRRGAGTGRWKPCLRCSPSCGSVATAPPPHCRAGSNRWWRLAGR